MTPLSLTFGAYKLLNNDVINDTPPVPDIGLDAKCKRRKTYIKWVGTYNGLMYTI